MNRMENTLPKVKLVVLIFVLLALTRVLAAWALPVITDEAYYFLWARYPDLGYFDHPPIVAWLGLAGTYFKGSVFYYRLGGLLLQLLLFPLFISLCRKAGLKTPGLLASAALFMFFNVFGFVLGVLTTPDVPFFFAWTLALHEAAAALSTNPKRWLTAGAATALGLWSKYTMLLIGVVFLFALMRKKHALKTPWPYLGGVVCLTLLLPHLYWNMHNQWISVGFQMAHGIKGSHQVELALNTDLPAPTAPSITSGEYRLGQYFAASEEVQAEAAPLTKFIRRVTHFFVGQCTIWGALTIALIITVIERQRRQQRVFCAAYFLGDADPHVRDLLIAAALVPLLVFGILNFFEGVEGNWPAVYTVSGAIFCAAYVGGYRRMIPWLAGVNLLVIMAAVCCTHVVFPAKNYHKNRLLTETHGYAELTKIVRGLRGPLFADTYQIAAMLSFYDNDLKIAQWPGISRNSELTRRNELGYYDLTALVKAQEFWLITRESMPPGLTGFTAQELTEIKDCLSSGLIATAAQTRGAYKSPCQDPVHAWYLVRYHSNA